MIPLISRLVTVLRGSTSLASLGSRESLMRMSTIGVRAAFTRGGVARAKGMALTYARNLRRMDLSTISNTVEVLATLYFIASELFPESNDEENEERVANFATSDKLLDYAVVAHNWALSEKGRDKADDVYDALNELFTGVENGDIQAIMNLLVAPHLPRLRSAGYLFNLPYVEERAFWWDSIARSEEGVDTSGVTAAEILFFGKVIFGFLGAEDSVFTAEDQNLWRSADDVGRGTEGASMKAARALADRAFPANQSRAVHMILDAVGDLT